MLNLVRKFLAPDHATEDGSTRRLIIHVLTVGCIVATALAILDINQQPMLTLSVILLANLLLVIKNKLQLARWVSLSMAFLLISQLVFKNNGIRDTALLGLVSILIAAGLLAGRRGTVVFGLLIFTLILVLWLLESQGVIVNQFTKQNYPADYITIIIIVLSITIFQWLMINRLNHNIQKAKLELGEREKTEALLKQAELRYRGLVEKIPAVIYISEPGETGHWRYVNPQIAALTGYSAEEWIKDPHLWYRLMHPDDRVKTIELEKSALLSNEMPRLEYRLRTKDGRTIWIHDESLLTLDNENKVIVQGFMLDITARKTAENELQKRLGELQAVHGVSDSLLRKTDLQKLIRETGEQIRTTFKADNVLVGIHDPVTNLINFPYDYEDNTLRPNTPIRFGEGMSTEVMKGKQAVLINENWPEETSRLNAIYTNKIRPLSSLSMPIMTTSSVIGVITLESTKWEHAFTENDIRLLSTIAANLAVAIENTRLQETLKRENEIQEKLIAELETKNAELERFTYTASHDLKSPLITIRGFLGYLVQDARNGSFDRLEQDVQRISEATEKMHKLLNDLLELSRVGRLMNDPEEVHLDEVVGEALKRVDGQLKLKQAEVEIRGGLPVVFGDKERLIEVVQNLVDNACKFAGSGRRLQITIGTEIKDANSAIYVRDNGIGIDQEFHEKIFGLFDKLDANSEGTGIGLALVKRIVEVHGGRIWVESKRGMGATFYFTIGGK